MRSASRVARSGFARRFLFYFFTLAVFLLLFIFPQTASAQTSTTTSAPNSFAAPNMDPDVPRNQHTFAQATTIEVLSAIHCILTGIDPIDPAQGCLGINPETNKLGISKPELDEYGRPEVTGMIGVTVGLVTSTYQPIASTGTYVNYLSDNFGIVTKAHAAEKCDETKFGYGFCGLRPILQLWETSRNIAYALLTLAFMFIGIGVMLRIKIDPRTVMTIQNQIPRVIISIILITLSYAISALLVDLMWISTYAGTYLITKNHDPIISNCNKGDAGERLSDKAISTIIQTPITYFNSVFSNCDPDETAPGIVANDKDGGFHYMTDQVGDNFGNVIGNVAKSLFFDGNKESDCGYNPIKCFKKGVKTLAVNSLQVMISLVAQLIIFVILVITMFKIWFNLLKAFVYTLVYIILGPIIIVFGLLPTKPMGFESWLRRLFVNIAVFPITVFLFVAARLLLDLYGTNKSPDQFIPPLVGNPAGGTNFGALMAFGVLMIAPTIQTILRDKMGVKNIGTPGIVGAGIAAGAAVVGAPVNRAIKHMSRSDHRTQDYGILARAKQQTGHKALGAASRLPGFLGMSARKQQLRNEGLRTEGSALRGAAARIKRNEGESKKEYRDRLMEQTPGEASRAGSRGGGAGTGGTGGGAPRRRFPRLRRGRRGGTA